MGSFGRELYIEFTVVFRVKSTGPTASVDQNMTGCRVLGTPLHGSLKSN